MAHSRSAWWLSAAVLLLGSAAFAQYRPRTPPPAYPVTPTWGINPMGYPAWCPPQWGYPYPAQQPYVVLVPAHPARPAAPAAYQARKQPVEPAPEEIDEEPVEEALEEEPLEPVSAPAAGTKPAESLPAPTESGPAPTVEETPLDLSEAKSVESPDQFNHYFWAETETLLWRIKGTNLPPLITRGSVTDALPGAIGQPGTSVLFGGEKVNDDYVIGTRVRLGAALCNAFGVEVGGFYLMEQEEDFAIGSNNLPGEALARPFFDTTSSSPGSLLFGFPGAFDGVLGASVETKVFGAEANVIIPLGEYVRGYVGGRYASLREDLEIDGQFRVRENGLAFFNGETLDVGAVGTISDDVTVRNDFYGGQLGLVARLLNGPLTIDLRGALAIGATVQRADLSGSTVIDSAGIRSAPTGLLVQRSNAGSYSNTMLTVIPEVNLKFSMSLSRHLQLVSGYGVTYWSQVARAGDQLDLTLDTRAVPVSGAFDGSLGARPVLPELRQSDFWMHGGNVGLAFTY